RSLAPRPQELHALKDFQQLFWNLSRGDLVDIDETDISLAPLYAADIRPVEATCERQGLLG
ncbi:MAG TPA: hypothetical protein VNV86_01920, partial [Candidatus Acidoferrum sp.]|nr:hypothetical protein [Candidatus Acidoferrum sp.]